MNWDKFDVNGNSKEKAFEAMVNQIFKSYCKYRYKDNMTNFIAINGNGGDGGIEAYAELLNGKIVAVQSKWFPEVIQANEIKQIRNSIKTALMVRNNIEKYVVCVPRDLADRKNGKNGIVQNTERQRIKKLFQEFKDCGVTFEIWGDFELLEFLTNHDDLAGVYRFWFENSEISFQTIEKSIEIQKNGWLVNRYNSKMHVKNSINHAVDKLTGNMKEIEIEMANLQKIIFTYKDYLLFFEKYIYLTSGEEKKDLNKIYEEHKVIIEKLILTINKIKECLINEKNIKVQDERIIIDTSFFENINEYKFPINYHRLKDVIKKIDNMDTNNYLKEIAKKYNSRILIVKGDLGTGKTHGIVNQIENEIKKENIAILIRAADIEKNFTWKEILTKVLGLSNVWSTDEIWNALNSIATRNDGNREQNDYIKRKVLVCIDGIDESNDNTYWKEKIDEAEYLSKENDRLRFCFIGRNYAFNEKQIKMHMVLNLDFQSEYDMNEMYKKYIQEYHIEINHSINVKNYLKTPLILKLFCEEYKDRKIDSFDGIKLNLADLFKLRLNELNLEFKNQIPNIEDEDIVSRASKIIGDYLFTNIKISRSKIYELLKKDSILSNMSNENIELIIKKLQDYGIIHIEVFEDYLGIKNSIYYKGMQPTIDYIMADNLVNFIMNNEISKVDTKIKMNDSILSLAALMLFEKKGTLICDIKDESISDYEVNIATTYAIVNSNPLKLITIKDRIKKALLVSPNNMRYILNEIIIPCSRIKKHPLGAELLHELLIDFENMANRDKIWSLPEYLVNENYRISDKLIINESNKTYYLNDEDEYDGLPLVYIWLLSGVNNIELCFYRNQIMNWALHCPNEFIKLLKKCNNLNDIQIVEQLYAIAMCLCFKLENNEIIKDVIDNIDNVFYEENNIKTFDFYIRTYIRAIAEKAFINKIITDKQKYLPPYNCNLKLDMNKNAINGTRMGGYSSIDYDLARYVLCDYLERRFFQHYSDYPDDDKIPLERLFSKKELEENIKYFQNNSEYNNALKRLEDEERIINERGIYNSNNIQYLKKIVYDNEKQYSIKEESKYGKQTEKFLNERAKNIGTKKLSDEQFNISVAYQFLLDNGWNEEEFYGKDKIDSLIRSQYYPATHGEKSNVMTFTEKYVWCARNQIMGYLADNLYKDKNETKKYMNYTEIDDVLIPITELEEKDKNEKEFEIEFLPEDVFNQCIVESKDDIRDWINSHDSIIDIEKWINFSDKYVLNSTNLFTSDKNDLEYKLWISTGIIKKSDIVFLKDNIDKKQSRISELVNNSYDFSEYTISDNSKTPFEIINFFWNKTIDSKFENISLLNKQINRYNIFKTAEKAYNVHTKLGEVNYIIPSLKVRKMLEINNAEEFYYKNHQGDILSFYKTNNKSWENVHDILVVDKKKFDKELVKNSEKLIWIIRIEKELSATGKEKYKDIIDYNNIYAICWYENGRLLIKNIEEMN